MPDFDFAVIGAGAAGMSVTYAAARLGLSVVLIERGAMGGECLNTGCVPSKALLACAGQARSARAAGRFGVILPEPLIDWKAVRAHVHGAIAAIAPHDSEERYRGLGAQVIREEARFIAPDAIAVADQRIRARRFVIAAGARPAIPPIKGLESVPFWTNETVFALAEKPEHLLILGGGAIGIEMAEAFSGLGCRVTVIEAERVLGLSDPLLVRQLRERLSAEGIVFAEGAKVVEVAAGPELVLANGKQIAGSHLLIAVGRRPNIEGLGLEAARVRFGPRGIATDQGLRSLSNRRVYAAGDIADPEGIGPRYFTHVGSYHAGIILRRAVFRLPVRLNYGALPRVTYTDPELAEIGLTEAEARAAAGASFRIAEWDWAENDRAVTENRTEGQVRLFLGRRDRLLGAAILAPGAGELVAALALAISRRLPAKALADAFLPYPTRAEAIKRAASLPLAERLFSLPVRRLVSLLRLLP